MLILLGLALSFLDIYIESVESGNQLARWSYLALLLQCQRLVDLSSTEEEAKSCISKIEMLESSGGERSHHGVNVAGVHMKSKKKRNRCAVQSAD